MTQEFHISVTPVRNDEYLVRTERVAPGVPLAEEQIVWDVDDWLTQADQLMDDPLLGVLQGYDRSGGADLPRLQGSAPPLSLVDLGQQLYAALFQGTLRDSWLTAQGIAQHRGEVLRLRLGLKGERLPRLPWEVLHGGDGGIGGGRLPAARPLATGTDVIFSRYQPGTGMAGSSLPVEPEPLRILMAIAAPTDQEQLNLKQEALYLQRELRAHGALPEGAMVSDPARVAAQYRALPIGSFPDIEVTILDQPGREQLTQALEQGNYQVFHFAGHSNLGAAGGSLYLVNRRTGLTEMLSGDDLAGLLVNNHIQMAVFNSCRGAYTSADIQSGAHVEDRNLATALVDRGIPAVLAMAERIPDDVALTLTRLFYRNLKQGYPIDLSLSRARQGLISAYGSHQLYWALPILYLHPDFDGYLTGSDRSLDNPADSVMRMPRVYDPSRAAIVAAGRVYEAAEAQPDRFSDNFLESDNFSEAELLAAVDDLEYSDETDDLTGDLTNDWENDDRSMVAGLIGQLTQPQSPEEPILAQDEDLLPDAGATPLSRLPEPRYQQASSAPLRSPKGNRLQPVWKRLGSRKVLALGATGAVAIALAGVWLATRRPASPVPDLSNLPTLVSPTSSTPDVAALQRADTPELTTIAVNHFSRNEMPAGQQAVEVLLDRNALVQAESALAVVRRDRVDSPAISFLRGRLAWQSIQVGNTNYSPDDARRYWEFATQGQPGSPQYHEALGFAYYGEGKSRDAIQAWLKTLSLLQAQNTGQPAADDAANPDLALPTQLPVGKDALTAYAGIALALLQASTDPGATQREELVSKAVKLYQMVNAQDPVNFQPAALTKSENWLWTQSAIQNWQKLSSLQQ